MSCPSGAHGTSQNRRLDALGRPGSPRTYLPHLPNHALSPHLSSQSRTPPVERGRGRNASSQTALSTLPLPARPYGMDSLPPPLPLWRGPLARVLRWMNANGQAEHAHPAQTVQTAHDAHLRTVLCSPHTRPAPLRSRASGLPFARARTYGGPSHDVTWVLHLCAWATCVPGLPVCRLRSRPTRVYSSICCGGHS